MDLRRAAERVRVLDLVAPAMRLVDRRRLEQAEEIRRRCALPAERPQRVNLWEEAVLRPLESLERDRAGDVGSAR